MKEAKYERYIAYKTGVLSLFVGILIGVLTNYVSLFFPQRVDWLILCIIGLSSVFVFYVSRYTSPRFQVVFDIPKSLVENLKGHQILLKDNPVAFQRFIYQCNMNISIGSFKTIFRPSKRNLSLYAFTSSPRFMPYSNTKHLAEVGKIAIELNLSEEDKKSIIHAAKASHEPYFMATGDTFDYICMENRLLRGKGFFFLDLFGRDIGCLIVPSLSCTLSRFYEQYNVSLERYLSVVLKKLINDQKFRSSILQMSNGW